MQPGRDLQPAQGAAADEPGAGARIAPAGRAGGALRRPVRQAALERHRNRRWPHPAVLSRRHRQCTRIQRARAHPGSAAHGQGACALGDDHELRPRPDRRRLRRPAPPRILGPGLGRAFAAVGRVPAHGRGGRRLGALHGNAVGRAAAQPKPCRLLHLARGAAAPVRGGAHAPGAAAAGLVQPGRAPAVDRHAHRGAGRRARPTRGA